jgi:hypothetical protein
MANLQLHGAVVACLREAGFTIPDAQAGRPNWGVHGRDGAARLRR